MQCWAEAHQLDACNDQEEEQQAHREKRHNWLHSERVGLGGDCGVETIEFRLGLYSYYLAVQHLS